MPQTTVQPLFRAAYPILAPAQKAPGFETRKSLTATAATWLAGITTVTVPAHGVTVGASVGLTLEGFVPAAYNGQFTANAASATTFTYPQAVNPGTATTMGKVLFMALPASAVPNANLMKAPGASQEAAQPPLLTTPAQPHADAPKANPGASQGPSKHNAKR